MKRKEILDLIDLERERQIGKGYAAEQDERYTQDEWRALVQIQLGARTDYLPQKARFVRAAAVCVAALEALPDPSASSADEKGSG